MTATQPREGAPGFQQTTNDERRQDERSAAPSSRSPAGLAGMVARRCPAWERRRSFVTATCRAYDPVWPVPSTSQFPAAAALRAVGGKLRALWQLLSGSRGGGPSDRQTGCLKSRLRLRMRKAAPSGAEAVERPGTGDHGRVASDRRSTAAVLASRLQPGSTDRWLPTAAGTETSARGSGAAGAE